jgi:uncharacterized protein (DUF427 family)
MASQTRRVISRVVKRVGPEHPITVEPSGERVVARIGRQVVADTDAALVLREAGCSPVYYFPISAVDSAMLHASSKHTYCPYKGEASYYSLRTDAGVVADAAWWYPEPYADVVAIAGHVAFYPERVAISGN